MIDEARWKKAAARLDGEEARNVWFGTVREDGRPHLVPLWFIFHQRKVWVGIGSDTQKHRNVQRNPNVVVALEDGESPVIIEGVAREEPGQAIRDSLAPYFMEKYDWDFRADTEEDWLLVSVEPRKILHW